MTLRKLIACKSPLADGFTVREHLAASNCDPCTGGTDRLVPITSLNLDLDLKENYFEIDKKSLEIEAKVNLDTIEIELTDMEIMITNKNMEIQNEC